MQCVLLELSPPEAISEQPRHLNVVCIILLHPGCERMPSLLWWWSYEYLNKQVSCTLNYFWGPAVTFDVRNPLRIDFDSLRNSHYCQESPQWSSNIFSILPICMTHIMLTSLLPFQKQSPRPMICYQEISYRTF